MIKGYLKNGVYYRHNDIIPSRVSLLFIHGLSGSSSAWLPYQERFSSDYNLVFFDLRGHGKSIRKRDADYYSMANTANDIKQLSQKLGLAKFILVGHSFGALLAIDFAQKNPEMINGLILLAPDYRLGKTLRAKLVRSLLGPAKIFSLKPFRERIGIHVDYAKFSNTGDWDFRRIYIDVRNTSFRVYCYYLKSAGHFDSESILSRIKAPTLIVHGRKDTIFPVSDSVAMAKKLPLAQLKILPSANHILVLNNPQEVGDEIADFCNKKRSR